MTVTSVCFSLLRIKHRAITQSSEEGKKGRYEVSFQMVAELEVSRSLHNWKGI